MDLDEARIFIRANHRAVLATYRRDGATQLSPVACGVDADGMVVVSTRETAAKTLNVRRDPRASLCAFTDEFYGTFVQVEGPAEVVSLPEAMDGLVDYYRTLSGEHPDWDDYRTAMVRERRVLLRIDPARAGPNFSG